MHLACRQCGRELPAEDLDLDRRVASCRNCNAVFSFAADTGERAGSGSGARRLRPTVALPRGITAEERGGDLRPAEMVS